MNPNFLSSNLTSSYQMLDVSIWMSHRHHRLTVSHPDSWFWVTQLHTQIFFFLFLHLSQWHQHLTISVNQARIVKGSYSWSLSFSHVSSDELRFGWSVLSLAGLGSKLHTGSSYPMCLFPSLDQWATQSMLSGWYQVEETKPNSASTFQASTDVIATSAFLA